MSPPAAPLCSQCAEIDFDFFTNAPQKDEDLETVPSISWSSLFPEQCQFCQLLAHCLLNSGEKTSPQATLRGVYTNNEFQLYIDDEGTRRRLDYSIRSFEPSLSGCSDEGPHNSNSFDVEELRQWLELCDAHKCLPSDRAQQPLPEELRLIDVIDCCIVQPKAHVKYCALSYVWGNRKQPLLNLSNKDELESREKRPLERLGLPRTILDAMSLCRDIKCRYLWVDSLCIIQDSNENKHSQISSMADVYSQSFLAFIATAGKDSDAGLSPYRGRENDTNISYLVRKNSKGSFVASLSPQIAAQEIAKSTWASRGWTLQEYALSRRVLFFTGTYAFLRCEKELRCEDFGLGFSSCYEQDRKWDLPLPPFYRRINDPDRHYPRTFSRLLAQFVRRTLSFEQDILDAFIGILTRMEHGEDGIGAHMWGLPSREFGAALQWMTHEPWPSVERAGFPSWSWVGWVHENDTLRPGAGVPDIYEGSDGRMTDVSVLTWYKYHDDKRFHIAGKADFDRILCYLDQGKWANKPLDDPNKSLSAKTALQSMFNPKPGKNIDLFIKQTTYCEPPLSHHIFLWASCVSLYIDRGSTAECQSATWKFAIRIKKGGPVIGHIQLRPEWRKREPDFMPFFVSTASVSSGELKFKIVLTKLHRVTDLPSYKRIQVSQTPICATDWALANPKSRLIALV